MASLDDVIEFLKQFHAHARQNGICIPITRKNRDELGVTRLMPHERTDLILELNPDDYSAGPFADDDGSGEDVWVFGKKVGGVTIYIKLKLTDNAKCLSFHIAEYPMNFPLRKAR
jgi:hypothetical protein